MKSERYRKFKCAAAAVATALVLSGADCGGLLPTCEDGPGDAVRTLSGQDAIITVTGDNDTYEMVMMRPDSYLHWKTEDEAGSHTIRCFRDYWNAHFSSGEKNMVIWIASAEPRCGTISSLQYDELTGMLVAELKRPNKYYASLEGSGNVVINIGQSCNPVVDPCWGQEGLTDTCFQPFMSFDNGTGIPSVPRAELNFGNFDGAEFRYADLRGTALSHASFVNADLRNVDFNDALFFYTDLTGAQMDDVIMGNARVFRTTAPNGAIVNSVQRLLENLSSTTTSISLFITSSISIPTFTSTAGSSSTSTASSTSTTSIAASTSSSI